ADDRLKLPHHQRVRMRAEHGSEEIVAVRDVGDPIAHRLVDGVLERLRSGVDASDRRAEQLHPEDVQRLALHVFGAHVDVTAQPEKRAHCRRRNAVLACPGLSDDAPLAHSLREESLTESVVDLVRARMCQILTLQNNAGAAERLADASGFVEGSRAAYVVREQLAQPRDERLVLSGGEVRGFQLRDWSDERLRHEPAPVDAVVSARVRVTFCERRRRRHGHNVARLSGSSRGSSSTVKRCRSLSWSLTPGDDSTPDDRSMAYGRTRSIASDTLETFSPPERM